MQIHSWGLTFYLCQLTTEKQVKLTMSANLVVVKVDVRCGNGHAVKLDIVVNLCRLKENICIKQQLRQHKLLP